MDKISVQIEESRVKYGLTQEECSKMMGLNSKTYRNNLDKAGAFTYKEMTSYVAHIFCRGFNIREYNLLWSNYESFGMHELPWVREIFAEYGKENEYELCHKRFLEKSLPIKETNLSDSKNNYIGKKYNDVLIPLYPSLKASCSCGTAVCNCENVEHEDIQLPKEYLREYLGIHSANGVHAIIADGESMEPTINHGDIIFVTPCDSIKDGKVYIIAIDDETYCKRVFKDLDSGGLILRSDNPIAPEIKLSKVRVLEMRVIGRVGVVLSRVVL